MEESNTQRTEEDNKEDIAADIKPETTTDDKEKTDHTNIVWRDTMEDGSIAVSNYSHEVKEKETKDLKDWRADFDKITTSNINLYVDYPTA